MSSEPRARLDYLDALRGLAALWVLIEHTYLIPYPVVEPPSWLHLFVVSGARGVELFFVVSAFSLCYAMPGHERDKRPLVGFAIRRFFRIAPLFYAMLLVMLLWNPWGEQFTWDHIVANVFFYFNVFEGRYQWSIVPAGWTIGVEMPFYLIFPLIYFYARDLPKAVLVFLLSLVVAIVGSMIVQATAADPADYLSRSLISKLPIFGAGILTFHLLPKIKSTPDIERWGVPILLGAVVIFFAIESGKAPLVDGYYWYGVMFSMIIVGLAISPLPLLVNDATAWLGKISYSIYLLHIPVILVLQPLFRQIEALTPSRTAVFGSAAALTIVATVALAAVVNRVIEEPVNQWGRSLAKRYAGRREVSVA